MSWVSGWSGNIGMAEATAMTPAVETMLVAKAALSTAVGVYGLVKQYDYQREQLSIAKQAADTANSYLNLATGQYNNIAMPAFNRMVALLDRFNNGFAGYYTTYLNEAFRQQEYTPDYAVQQGRAMASVQAKLDRASIAKRRATGRFNTGRRCANAVSDAILAAQARVDACRAGYQFEALRKRKMDAFFFSKWHDGSAALSDIAAHAVRGINGGVSIAEGALNGTGQALGVTSEAIDMQLGALANRGDFWGGIANGGFQMAGASAYRTTQTQATTTGWGTVSTPAPSYEGSAKDGGYGGFDKWDHLVAKAHSNHIANGYNPAALNGM